MIRKNEIYATDIYIIMHLIPMRGLGDIYKKTFLTMCPYLSSFSYITIYSFSSLSTITEVFLSKRDMNYSHAFEVRKVANVNTNEYKFFVYKTWEAIYKISMSTK